MSRPLLLLALALILGALLGAELAAAWPLLGLAGALVLAAVLAPARVASAALGAAAVAIGAAGAAVERAHYEMAPLALWLASGGEDAGPVHVRGIAATDPSETDGRWSLTIDVESLVAGGVERPAPGRVRIDVGGQSVRSGLIEGDRVSLWAELRRPRGFGNPGAYDAKAQARRDGVHGFGYCKTPLLVRRAGRGEVGLLRDLTARARDWSRRRLQEAVPPGPEQAVARAMALGEQTALPRETAETFRASGTYHVLAISGAQVALLAALLLAGFRRLRFPRGAAAFLMCGALAFYAELVGGQVPVVRAAAMAAVFVLGRWLYLDADLANLLGLAGAILVVHRPSAAGDVAFQLSFAATLGLLLLTPSLLGRCPRLPLRLHVAAAASLAAQAALVPLLIAHFHRLAPAALALNLVAVPLGAAVLIAALAAIGSAAVAPAFGELAGAVCWLAAHALLRTGDLVRHVPVLDVRLPTPPPWSAAIYVAGLALLAAGWRRGVGWTLTVAGFVGLVAGSRPPAGDGRLHLTMLDVGQGDSILVRSPKGRLWLVDAGGSFDPRFDVGEAVVGRHLWFTGARRLDRLLVTHAHPDHAGGVPFLLRSFAVREVWEGIAPSADPGYRRLDAALRASRLTRRAVLRGVSEDWDGVAVEVLGPLPAPAAPARVRNDDSVVVSLRWGTVRLLLAGDVESAGEVLLSPPPAAVLKVPHHGSRSSSSAPFVAGVAPRLALISVGYRSRFGHPHVEVLERYLTHGALVLRTDVDGAVTVSTDGASVWVRTTRGGGLARVR